MTTPTPPTGRMHTPPVVTADEWEAARQQLLLKEKAQTRARDALAAERRRMPWTPVDKDYTFDGPNGKRTLRDLFDNRRQLIVYRAFFEPGVYGWPEHACRGCSVCGSQTTFTGLEMQSDTFDVNAHLRSVLFSKAARCASSMG